ncbi:MAG: metalloprotease PmbA, partial [Burkholderiales bacterium]|nr:metalloprotease PmbA [Burkholderiales bacterium]
MHNTHFSTGEEELKRIAREVLGHAKRLGAGSAEAEVSSGIGQEVTVRKGAVETIEYNRDKGLSVTVYFGHQRGSASSSDLSAQAIADT